MGILARTRVYCGHRLEESVGSAIPTTIREKRYTEERAG